MHPLGPGGKTPIANCAQCKDRNHLVKDCPCLLAGRPCHGFHAASLDTALIDTWWDASPSAGVGVACGPAHLIVLDVDVHPAPLPDRDRLLPGIPIHESVNLDGLSSGFDTLALLAALRRQPDPARDEKTLRVRTPSGGLHIWYRNAHPKTRFRCSAGSSTKVALAWQVDVRAHGGYIIAPGTRTKEGTYRAEGPARLPAPLPDWLCEELIRTGHAVASLPLHSSIPALPSRRSRPKIAALMLAPLLERVTQCGAAAEGTGFTEKLNRAAYTAGGLVAAGHLLQDAVREELLQAANDARPWQIARNAQIVDAGLAAGAARPLNPEGFE
ncbi:bifunctional DNA primase/polymerase [Streptomyces avermitilis]|uniref:bifunctional DNA primase/polymerase n=1 Tax=Streptomyces avermitilis TaxID=33903 RepID=UPI0033A39706